MSNEPSDAQRAAINRQEVVADEFLSVIRLAVPGGWIYNSFDKEHGVMGSVFVPSNDPSRDAELVGLKSYCDDLTKQVSTLTAMLARAEFWLDQIVYPDDGDVTGYNRERLAENALAEIEAMREGK